MTAGRETNKVLQFVTGEEAIATKNCIKDFIAIPCVDSRAGYQVAIYYLGTLEYVDIFFEWMGK